MPTLGSQITTPPKRERINATNKINIPNGTRPAQIVDVWIYNVDADGKYTKEKTGEQKVSLKIRFEKRPDIVLDKRMRAYLSEKSHFAKLIGTLTGLKPGSDEMRNFDTDKLIGKKVLVTTEYVEPYTNVTTITSAQTEDDGFGDIPPQTNSAALSAERAADEYESFPDDIPF